MWQFLTFVFYLTDYVMHPCSSGSEGTRNTLLILTLTLHARPCFLRVNDTVPVSTWHGGGLHCTERCLTCFTYCRTCRRDTTTERLSYRACSFVMLRSRERHSTIHLITRMWASAQRDGSRERDTAAPYFRPMSIVATVAHISYC